MGKGSVRQDIRLAGFGGQGIILAGYLLGKAACLYGEKEAVMSQSYGPEARGGACAAQVIISDQPVDYPDFDQADCLVLMSQEAFGKYGSSVKPGGIVILDSDLVKAEVASEPSFRAPFTRIAQELGNRIAANMAMLGFLAAVTGFVRREAIEEAIRTEIKPEFVNLNLTALARGYAHAREPEMAE